LDGQLAAEQFRLELSGNRIGDDVDDTSVTTARRTAAMLAQAPLP
jgi:hypothetical protein